MSLVATDPASGTGKTNTWLNPPYTRSVGEWIDRLRDHGDGVALVFNRTDTDWFKRSKADAYFFLQKRVKFLRASGERATAPGCRS